MIESDEAASPGTALAIELEQRIVALEGRDARAVLDRYAGAWRTGPPGRPYARLPKAVSTFRPARTGWRAETHILANRWLLARLLVEDCAPVVRIPANVAAWLADDRARIAEGIIAWPDERLALGRDGFRKDIALALGRLFPVRPLYADPFGRIPFDLLWKGGVRQMVQALRTFGLEARGVRPFLQLHVHDDAFPGWGPPSWEPCHLAAAEIVRLNRRLKGLFGAGWIVDPQLARVSPHLAWPSAMTVAAGGALFYHRTDHDGTRTGALKTSETRRRLFAAGEYVPEEWFRVLSRPVALRWAARARDGGAS